MKNKIHLIMIFLLCLLFSVTAVAGPYSGPSGQNPGAIDAGILGFVGGEVNPVFTGWATGYLDYLPAPGVDAGWQAPEKTLGPVTGSNVNIASLGDLNQTQIDAWLADPANNPGPGEITLTFDAAIYNGPGQDFAVFENGFGSATSFFAELGYVDVSTDGTNWARFASDVIDPPPPAGYLQQDVTNVYNLVGKHANAYGTSYGTPFDLGTLVDNDLVLAGLVDLGEINYVRIVDIPGNNKDFLDVNGDAISDAWVTWGSGGVDLEAVGVINAVPVPAAVWLLGSGVIGLVGIRRNGPRHM